jgi:glycerophosphoryl diester phosphodiesterase
MAAAPKATISAAETSGKRIAEASRKAGLEIMVYYGGDDMAVHREIVTSDVDYINLDRPDLFAAVRSGMAELLLASNSSSTC